MKQRISTRAVVLAGVTIALLLAAVVSYYATGSPDGLERVAENLGFAGTAGVAISIAVKLAAGAPVSWAQEGVNQPARLEQATARADSRCQY